MNSPLDRDLSCALGNLLDRQSIPTVNVTRILERSSHQRSRQPTLRVRLGATLAVAAMIIIVLTADAQRGWALGIGGHRSLSEVLAQAFKLLHLPMPTDATRFNLRIENYQYADESRIQAVLPFRLIEPSGIPARYDVTIHGETRRNGNIGIYWLRKRSPTTYKGAKAISSDSIEVDEFVHGHALGIPPSLPDKSVVIEFNPDGSLKRAHEIVVGERAVRRFTIRNVDIAVIVNQRRPGPIADAIQSAMLSKAKEVGGFHRW